MVLSSRTRRRRVLATAGALGVATALTSTGLAAANGLFSWPGHGGGHGGSPSQHVLLLSVDGLHQSDLDWYVHTHPTSTLASLTRGGVSFTNALTPFPSDSFPGMVGQVTGGNPSSTGVYYDDTWNRALLPAGTTDCAHATPGAEVTYFEQLDRDPTSLDAGQGLTGLPGSILNLTGDATSLIDPAQLPVDPATCKPVYPHSYLKVNTIFEVARTAGLRTAWADKHAAYDVLNGPSGTGIQDLFTPEINSDAPTAGASIDWTKDNALTQQYDGYKVQAVLNEINGFDHSGATQVGTPGIFGMNFQSVSTAQKLPTSGGKAGGYLADGTPGPVLASALDFVNTEVGQFEAGLAARGLQRSTTVVLSAKHGQSPTDPAQLMRIADGPIVDALNAAWKAASPQSTKPLVTFSIDDDGVLLWLSDRSPVATRFAAKFLLAQSGTGTDIAGAPKAYTRSGLSRVFAGRNAARLFGVPQNDARVPDLVGIAQTGVVYTGGKGKIAEHGGANPQDRHVPLVISGAAVRRPARYSYPVETTQIAPTILTALGLDPRRLQAVREEHTAALPLG